MNPSNYIIKDILQTARKGDNADLRKVCTKYLHRYAEDADFASVMELVLANLNDTKRDLEEIESFLSKFLQIRTTCFSASGLWFLVREGGPIKEPGNANAWGTQDLCMG